jgi:chromosome partitioning protein
MKTIALVNQKGGVGKTATTASLGVWLVQRGKRVLLIDFDPQASLTDSLGFKQPDELSPTISNLLEKIITDTPITRGEGILQQSEGVFLMPSNIELAGMDVMLASVMSRETILRTYINEVKGDFDYILVDCPPTLGMLTINAMTAADSLIIPCQSQYLSAKGLEQLLKSVNRVKRLLNQDLRIDGILLTMVDNRTNFSKEMGELLRNTYSSSLHVFHTEIPFSVRASEMSAEGKSIYCHDPNGKVASAYRELTREVLALENNKARSKSTHER